MNRRGEPLIRGVAAGVIAALAGCASPPPALDPGGCPPSLRRAVVVSVSVSPIAPRPGTLDGGGSVPLIAGTDRRLLVAVHIARIRPRVRILADALDLLTYGGTLDGRARIVRPRGAERRQSLTAEGGWLELAPFIPGAHLHSRTEVLDVRVVPGGDPRAILVVRPPALWWPDGRARSARDLTLHFTTAAHMTRVHAVDATATFHFRVQHLGGARERWHCSIDRNFTLVTHRQALANLWVLRPPFVAHVPPATLAVFDPRRGTFPLVFPDPQSARAFADWIRQRHARRLNADVLGLLGASDRFVALPKPPVQRLQVRQWDRG